MRLHWLICTVLLVVGCPEKGDDSPTTEPYQPMFGSASPATQVVNQAGETTVETEQFGTKDTTAEGANQLADVGSDTSDTVQEADIQEADIDSALTSPNEDTSVEQPDIDTYVAVPTDIEFEEPDAECTPDCDGKVCGANGCGSVCGFCEYGKACDDEGQCIPVCDPVTPCLEKVCGPDGCGGTCGACEPNFACGEDTGLCYEADCVPQCDEKECGPDQCGGVCGTCKGTKLCDTDVGECVSNPCGSIDFKGACADKTTVAQCVDGEIVLTNCALEDPAFGCLWDPVAYSYGCDTLPDCTPDCSMKQCGDGGCNYNCGNCYENWTCENFQCVPQPGGQCGTVPEIGVCINNDLYFCSDDSIGIEPCTELGKTCQFDPPTQSHACK